MSLTMNQRGQAEMTSYANGFAAADMADDTGYEAAEYIVISPTGAALRATVVAEMGAKAVGVKLVAGQPEPIEPSRALIFQ